MPHLVRLPNFGIDWPDLYFTPLASLRFTREEEASFALHVDRYLDRSGPTVVALYDGLRDHLLDVNEDRMECGLFPLRGPSLSTFRRRIYAQRAERVRFKRHGRSTRR